MPDILTVEHLTHTYSVGTPFERVAVDDVSLRVGQGEFVALIGHTGSGKSTLIQHFNGLLAPTSGRVLVDGQELFKSKEVTLKARFKVGLVFQYPEYQLFEETVYKDIAFGPCNMGLDEQEVDRRVRMAAAQMGLPEELLEVSPFDLSGGQKRRVGPACSPWSRSCWCWTSPWPASTPWGARRSSGASARSRRPPARRSSSSPIPWRTPPASPIG